MDEKPVAEFDPLLLLTEDLDDADPSEQTAQRLLELGQFIGQATEGKRLHRAIAIDRDGDEALLAKKTKGGFYAIRSSVARVRELLQEDDQLEESE